MYELIDSNTNKVSLSFSFWLELYKKDIKTAKTNNTLRGIIYHLEYLEAQTDESTQDEQKQIATLYEEAVLKQCFFMEKRVLYRKIAKLKDEKRRLEANIKRTGVTSINIADRMFLLNFSILQHKKQGKQLTTKILNILES